MFIIGPPRSGTTLLYQVLADRYTFAYFSNFMAQFHRSPIVAARLQKMMNSRPRPSAEYTSDRGKTVGWSGPHEAGAFWYRWFPSGDQPYVPAGVTPSADLAELRQEVAGISRVFDASMLFKNVYNTMRVAPLSEALPNACFLVCHRDPIDAAQSILDQRVRTFGSRETWWSLPPREIADIKRHPYWEQVVEQVYYTQQQVARDAELVGADRFYDVHYESLCRDVHGVLEGISRFFAQRSVRVRPRGEVPPRFVVSSGPRVDPIDYDRIARKVHDLWG